MTSPTKMRRGLALRAYLAASHGLGLAAKPILKRRLARTKEHPTRWQEKLGRNLAERPTGQLVWLHAVGLGEVLSLRGLISRMAAIDPDLSFLVTSTTRTSADVFATQLPPRTLHQFLPVDAPKFRRRFLDHFAPDLCIWVEQDLWPGFVVDLDARGIPQSMVAARMNDAAFKRHQKAQRLYADLYSAMTLITAQDDATAAHLAALGATVEVSGSLKPAAPPLAVNPDQLSAFQDITRDRFVWAVAPAHAQDAAIARQAHATLLHDKPDALLIIAPRFPAEFDGGTLPRMSQETLPQPADAVWLCDTFGDLGLIYRIADAVLVGGTFSDIEGHNPWEAAVLDTAVMHGPRTANFASDFDQLHTAEACIAVNGPTEIAAALTDDALPQTRANAQACVHSASQQVDAVAQRLCALLGNG